MAYNYERARRVAARLIEKYGNPAILRRTAGDRPCVAVIVDYTPLERMGKLINPIDRVALISTIDLTPPPHFGQDTLVTLIKDTDIEDEVLKIVAPPGKLAPGGTVVYWELQVRG